MHSDCIPMVPFIYQKKATLIFNSKSGTCLPCVPGDTEILRKERAKLEVDVVGYSKCSLPCPACQVHNDVNLGKNFSELFIYKLLNFLLNTSSKTFLESQKWFDGNLLPHIYDQENDKNKKSETSF